MPRTSARRADAGFTLLETLTVVAIIGIIAATGLPMIMNYMRHFRIRGATTELASALQRARMGGIMKSAQHGVVFATENATTYWVHIEDDQGPAPRQGGPETLNLAAPDAAQSTRFQLPPLITFATAAECTTTPALAPAFAPTDAALRFNRLGAACFPGLAPCAALPGPPALTNFLQNVNGGAFAITCLRDTRTGLARWVRIERGGRVEVQR